MIWNVITSVSILYCVNICAEAFLNLLLCLSRTVCEMTVSLSLAESHLRFKLLVVPRSLFPPRSVSGVCCPAVPSARQVVQEPPSLFTDQSQTHQNAVNEHFPPSGLHFACTCGFSPGGQWLRIGGEAQQVGATGHWGGKATSVWIRPHFLLTRFKEASSPWTPRVFL